MTRENEYNPFKQTLAILARAVVWGIERLIPNIKTVALSKRKGLKAHELLTTIVGECLELTY